MSRAPRLDDLHQLRVPTDVRMSPDGERVCFVVTAGAPSKDGYRMSLSGSRFRRVENLEHIRDRFVHVLVKGSTRLPSVPRS